jgi:hypothetical protein
MESFSAAALLFCSTAQPGPYPPPSAVVDAFVQAYNRQDAKAIAALVTQDAVIARGDSQLDGDELAKNYRDNLFTLAKPFRIKVTSRMAQGDLVADTEVYAGNNQPTETMVSVYQVKNGCIVRIWASSSGQED